MKNEIYDYESIGIISVTKTKAHSGMNQHAWDNMNDDFIQFDSDMSHVDDEDLFSLAERITVPEPHIINEMWQDDEKYNWQDVARCLRDNWHEIKGLVSLTDRDKMTDFAFDNHTKDATEQHSYALFKINNQVAK